MKSVPNEARALRAAEICRAHGISQTEIAKFLGASQSQVSRILAGKGQRGSRLFEEVCLYAERFEQGVTADAVRSNDEIVEAVQAAWDGSAAHARALATVIRSLSVLKASAQDRSGRNDGGG